MLVQKRLGFPSEHVIQLVNADATRAGILNSLDWISDKTQTGDLVLFYFSGNGSQSIFDQAHPDRVVATLVPYDSGREDGQNFDISEPELNRYLNKIAKNRRLVVVIDTCHSGGMGESQSAFPAPHPAEDSLPSLPVRGLGPSILPTNGIRDGAQLPLIGNYTLLSACRKSESAYEISLDEGPHHGVFSYHLAFVLAKADPTTSYRQVLDEVAARVSARFPHQNPQIDGEADRTLDELFGR